MARSIVVALCLLAMLATLAFVPASHAQTGNDLQLVTTQTVPGSRDVKFPHVAARFGQAHVSGTVDRNTATFWTKADEATSFSDPFGLGPSSGAIADYLVTSTAVANDGSIYAAWTHVGQNRIYLRRRAPNGEWGPQRTVGSANFPIFVEVGVSTTGTVLVTWLEPTRAPRYRTSTDQGVNWSQSTLLSEAVAYSDQMDIAAGPNGELAVSWTGTAGGQLQIFVGTWTGSGFDVRRVTSIGDGSFADATVTYGPDGKLYTAWRGTVNSVYYAERQPDGSFPRSRLATATAEGLVNVNADEQGNLHFAWIATPGGSTQLFYAFKEANGPFRGPLAVSPGGAIFNPHASASIDDNIYEHVVVEDFGGSGLRTRYALFRAGPAGANADPLIENNVDVFGGATSVRVTFANVVGNPTEVRYRWGAAPDDANSSGWLPFADLTVPIPEAYRTSPTCTDAVLYTQVRNATGSVESDPGSDAIRFDLTVQAQADVSNPFLFIGANPAAEAELAAVAGALGGDPNHTRIPLMYLAVSGGENDCTGLRSVGVGRSASSIETVIQITNEGYAGFVPLPGIASLEDGPVPVVLQLTDGAGNRRNVSTSLIFDETPPVLDATSPGTLSATAADAGDLLQDLTFSNVNVDDAQYGEQNSRGFWGVWLAVSRTPVANPAAADLEWVAVAVPGGASSFNVNGFSLASGLAPSQVTPGDYYVYARFLDGAGNPSDGALEVQVQSTATEPKLFLPQLAR